MRRLVQNIRALALTSLLAMAASGSSAQIATSPTPGRDLQAQSCNNTIPNAAPQEPRQALINCTGDFFTPFDGELMNFAIQRLERVTVTGKSTSPWRTLCIGWECGDLLGDEAVATKVNEKMGGWGDWLLSFLRGKPLEMKACTATANISSYARNITSKSTLEERTSAAGQIIVGYMKGGNFINTTRKEVLITFSDNGTQSFVYNTWDPAAPIPKNDLKLGDGKSRCP